MGIVEIRADWWNPRNPKCRNCRYWPGEGMDYNIKCQNEQTKVYYKYRDHNSRACGQFRLRRPE